MSKQKGAFGKYNGGSVTPNKGRKPTDEEVLEKFHEYIERQAVGSPEMNKPVPMKKKGWWKLW